MKILILILMLITRESLASTSEDCFSLAEYHGDHQKPLTVPASCKDVILKHANDLQKLQTSDGLIEVYGYKNMIYVDTYVVIDNVRKLQTSHLLAGSQTMLHELVSLEIDENTNKLYVFSRGKHESVFGSYDLSFIGNVVPLRHLKSAELNDCVNFRIDPFEKEVYFVSNGNKAIKVFNLNADKDGPLPEHSVKMKYFVTSEKAKFLSPLDIAVGANKIYVLDQDSVHVLNKKQLVSSGSDIVSSIDSESNGNFHMIALSSDEKKITLIGDSQTIKTIDTP